MYKDLLKYLISRLQVIVPSIAVTGIERESSDIRRMIKRI